MSYKPGLHILLDLRTQDLPKLRDEQAWNRFIEGQIKDLGLVQLGSVLHRFEQAGYTAVHCLTESHISIHTWPEHGCCTCDVFLSNYQKYNNGTAKQLAANIAAYFNAAEVVEKEVVR